MYFKGDFAMWCSSCNGEIACDAQVCSKCFSMRKCPCGSFVPMLRRQWVDWCDVCHHKRAWMCGECHSAGFRRRLCDSSTCSSTVDSRSFALCPRSDVARQTFELSMMVREDKARPLLVTEVVLRKLSLNTPNRAFGTPRGFCDTPLETVH